MKNTVNLGSELSGLKRDRVEGALRELIHLA
jgi:hypothetical protein